MKNQKHNSSGFTRFINDSDERKKVAQDLAARIRIANRIAKVAVNKRSRSLAYQLKIELAEAGLRRFAEYFRILSWEFDTRLGTVLLVKIGDSTLIHLPISRMTMVGGLDLRRLPKRITLVQKAGGEGLRLESPRPSMAASM